MFVQDLIFQNPHCVIFINFFSKSYISDPTIAREALNILDLAKEEMDSCKGISTKWNANNLAQDLNLLSKFPCNDYYYTMSTSTQLLHIYIYIFKCLYLILLVWKKPRLPNLQILQTDIWEKNFVNKEKTKNTCMTWK